jgi:hypothetical protein
VTVDCTLTSSGLTGNAGARGWQIAVAAEGARITGASLTGTDAGALFTDGFESHRLATAAGLEGLVSGVVLSIEEDVTLPAFGTSTIARLALEAEFPEEGACREARLFYRDGLRGEGQPVTNVVTYRNRSFQPSLVECALQLCGEPRNWTTFDCNDDGALNISDAICDLNFLFVGNVDPSCSDALDFNDDGDANISDAIASLNYLFSTGAPPPRGEGCQRFEGCGVSGMCE